MRPLQPLSIRDLIWLRAAREVKAKAEFEKYKIELEMREVFEKRNYLILCDLRQLMFSQLGFGKDQEKESEEYWSKLPTMADAGYKPQYRNVGKSRGVRKSEEKGNTGTN